MKTIEYIIKIFLYFAYVAVVYAVSCRDAKKASQVSPFIVRCSVMVRKEVIVARKRITIMHALLLCVCIGAYSVICGQMPYSSDRGNYVYRFVNEINISQSSIGLQWIQSALHNYIDDPNVLFFCISGLSLLITLIAYRYYPVAEKETLLFMGVSSYCLYSFYLLKQAPAMAFIALSIAAFMSKKRLLCIISIVLGILFHESAYVVIPVVIVMLGAKKKWLRVVEYLFLVVFVVFYRQISPIITSVTQQVIPGMEYQLIGFISDRGSIETSTNVLTVLHGIPYYYVAFFSIANRRELKEKIDQYDRYMVMTVFTAAMILLSFYMYWMWRFAAYFYFPIFVFSSQICKHTMKKQFKWIFGLLLMALTLRSLIQYYFLYGGF